MADKMRRLKDPLTMVLSFSHTVQSFMLPFSMLSYWLKKLLN